MGAGPLKPRPFAGAGLFHASHHQETRDMTKGPRSLPETLHPRTRAVHGGTPLLVQVVIMLLVRRWLLLIPILYVSPFLVMEVQAMLPKVHQYRPNLASSSPIT